MEKDMKEKQKWSNSSATFKVGAISLVFLIIGYQAAVFIHHSAVLSIEAARDHPDTVYIFSGEAAAEGRAAPAQPAAAVKRDRFSGPEGPQQSGVGGMSADGNGGSATGGTGNRVTGSRENLRQGGMAADNRAGSQARNDTVRRNASHSEVVSAVRNRRRTVESFRFNPNTVSIEDLTRLGFSEKQAASIDNYRRKGGRFRRKSDFARSFVVADSVYRRLEPFIDIPRIDINKADSATFDSLPGIGGYFAAKMVEFRGRLHGYSSTAQLMDIRNFDKEKFDGLKDLIECSEPEPYPLWTLPEDSLRRHPYIAGWAQAHGIVMFRQNNPPERWSVEELRKAGVLDKKSASRLAGCRIAPAD